MFEIDIHFYSRLWPNVLVIKSRLIRGKIEELVYYVNEFTIQLIIVTETWLSANIPDDITDISGFILARIKTVIVVLEEVREFLRLFSTML